MLLRICFIHLLMFCATLFSSGQTAYLNKSNDTLYVVKTVIVYDTIVVYDTLHVVSGSGIRFIPTRAVEPFVLQSMITPSRSKLLIFSERKSATLPIDCIILNTNSKTITSMKNLNFFGIVFLAFQNMVVAQTNIGMSMGAGSWWSTCDRAVGHTENAPRVSVGLVCDLPLSNHVIMSTGINYAYLLHNYSYKGSVDSLGIQTIGEGESASSYQQISIPLQIGYKVGSFKPFIGVEYAYRFSENWLNRQMNLANVLAGVSYDLNDHMALGIEYSRGLNKDFELKGDIYEPFTHEINGSYDVRWKSSRVELQLHYFFRKPKPKE